MSFKPQYLLLLTPLLMTACSSVPTGPSINVMPGPNVTFEQFKADDQECRDFAEQRAGEPSSNETKTAVKNAAITTAIGAAAGAAFDHGHGRGAAVGAGAGLLVGTLAGIGSGGQASRTTQVQYDNAYQQCMYSKGHSVPMNGNYETRGGKNRGNSYGPPPHTSNPPPEDYVVNHPKSEHRHTPSSDDYVVQEN